MLARECKKELTEHIIPFWDSLEDNDNGGFYGYVGTALKKQSTLMNSFQNIVLTRKTAVYTG